MRERFDGQVTTELIPNLHIEQVHFIAGQYRWDIREMKQTVSGFWRVSGQHRAAFTVTVTNNQGTVFSHYTGQLVNYGQFVGLTIGNNFTIAQRELGKDIEFDNLKMQGQIILPDNSAPAGSKKITQVLISGQEKDVKAFVLIDVNSTNQTDVNQTSAVAMEYTQGALSVVIHQLTQLDITHIPCIGHARYRVFAYTHANGTITPSNDIDLFENTTLLRMRQVRINKGLIMEAILELWTDVKFTIAEENGNLVLTPNHPDFQLHRLLDCLTGIQPDRENMAVSLGRLTEGGVIIKKLTISLQDYSLRMTLTHNMKSLCFYFGRLCFTRFEANLVVTRDNRYRITMKGDIPIAGIVFSTTTAVTTAIQAQDGSIQREALQNYFHANHGLLPRQLYDWVSQELQNVSFIHRPVALPDVVEFNATATILQENLNIKVVILRFSDRFYALYQIYLQNQELVDYLNAISSYEFGKVSVLKQTVRLIGITVSPVAIENMDGVYHIPRGLHFNTTIAIPQQCDQDRLCLMLRRHYPNNAFQLIATIIDTTAYELTALLPDQAIAYLLYQQDVTLTVKASKQLDPFYMVTATVTEAAFKNPVIFSGVFLNSQLSLSNPDRETEVPRAGDFGSPLVASNMKGTAQISEDGTIGQREYNATLKVECTIPKCQKLCHVSTSWKAVVGIVPNPTPQNRYWYTTLQDKVMKPEDENLEMACFLRAMGISYETHWPIRTSKLLPTTFVSYAKQNRVALLEECNGYRDIPEGLHINGKLNILCVDSTVQATSLPGKHDFVDMEINLPYLNIGKDAFVFTMAADSVSTTKGPYLRTIVGKPEPLQLQGFYQVFNMEIDGNISLSDEGFTLEIPDGFLVNNNGDRYPVYLCILATQDCVQKVANYRMTGYFKDLQIKVLARVREILLQFPNTTCHLDDILFDPLIALSDEIRSMNDKAQALVRQAKGSYSTAQNICKLHCKLST